MRLQFPTSGSATILGHDIGDVQMHRRIGYCPENPYFYDYLTARELLSHFGELFGMSPAVRTDKCETLLDAVGLDAKDRGKQLRKFSKGMLQRVGLAQALINDPEVVFFDEPMSGLDPVGRREIRELIAKLRDNGTTVFMSTHILADIEALCDEVAILRKGRLAAAGDLAELLAGHEGDRVLEVNVQSVLADNIKGEIDLVAGAEIFQKPNGVAIQIADENDLDAVLAITRKHGGSLISVQPVKQSLEDLFVKENSS
jgi:ABC-2 type transport system ATP-binding protein